MTRTDQVIDDMRGRCIPASAAEPLATGETLDYATGVMNAAVSTSISG